MKATKMTKEQFSQYLNSFSENKRHLMMASVNLVIEGLLWKSEYYSEIPDYMKKSLGCKVARFLVQTGIEGTFEADGLAQSCNFAEMKDGDLISFGKASDWSFTSESAGKVRVLVFKDSVGYYNPNGDTLLKVSVPYGCNPYNLQGRVELVKLFEEKFNPDDFLFGM